MENPADITFLHLDLDAFFVSVERLKNPSLNGKPIIVGGKSRRGVVASCSYEARKFGVHSAMPITQARRLLPSGIYMPGDMAAYSKYSGLVTQVIAERAPLFEKASIDEFYLDLTGMDRFFGTVKWAWELRDTIRKETGLPISAGLSINKTISKIATGAAKPDGRLHIPADKVKEFLGPLPIEKIPGVGKSTEQQLKKNLAIHTIGDLMGADPKKLERLLGVYGLSLWKRANGIDFTPVEAYSEAKSIGSERTFGQDTADMPFLKSTMMAMVEKLAYDMRQDGKMTGCVNIKLRNSEFETSGHQMRIPYTNRDDILIGSVLSLFEKSYNRIGLLRLIGVRFSHLVNANYQLQVFDNAAKNVNLLLAMDKIRARFGDGAIARANGLFTVKSPIDKDTPSFHPRG